MTKGAFRKIQNDFQWIWAVNWQWNPADCDIKVRTVSEKKLREYLAMDAEYVGAHYVVLYPGGGGMVRPCSKADEPRSLADAVSVTINAELGYHGAPIDFLVLHGPGLTPDKKLSQYFILRPDKGVDIRAVAKDMYDHYRESKE